MFVSQISRSLLTLSKRPLLSNKFVQICLSSSTSNGSKETENYNHRPQYATKSSYDLQQKNNRAKRSMDSESGIKVTSSKRFFLVLTGLYKRFADVPDYIPSSTSNRLGDRMRVVFIIFFVFVFFTLFLLAELGVVKGIERGRGQIINKSSSKE